MQAAKFTEAEQAWVKGFGFCGPLESEGDVYDIFAEMEVFGVDSEKPLLPPIRQQ